LTDVQLSPKAGEDPTGTRPVRLLGRTWDAFEQSVAAHAQAWPGGAVAAIWVALPELEERVLHTTACRDGSTDVVLVVTDWLPQLVADGSLLPLDDLLDAAPPDDWPQGWSDSMRSLPVVGGRRYAMAFHDGPEMLLYRRDLFEDSTEQRRFAEKYGYPLAPAATWDEFVDHARWFTRPEEDLWGTSLGGFPDGHNNVYDFIIQLWSRGGEVVDANDRPLLDSPAGIGALRFLDALWNELGVCDPAGKQRDSVQSGEDFASGRAAFAVNWAGMASMSAAPSSPTHGRVACAPVPAARASGPSTSLNVFWALAIAAGARDPELAWKYVRHSSSAAMDRLTSLHGCVGTRLSTWRDPEIRETSPAYAAIEEAHRNVRAMPATVRLPQIVAILNDMVNDSINRRTSCEDALRRAAEQIRALTEASES